MSNLPSFVKDYIEKRKINKILNTKMSRIKNLPNYITTFDKMNPLYLWDDIDMDLEDWESEEEMLGYFPGDSD